MFDAFRNEIIESKKSRIALFKWKILIVAILGGVSLGIGQVQGEESEPRALLFFTLHEQPVHMVIFLIPLICVYVDLLSKHLQIQIFAISKYFQKCDKLNGEKEFLNFKYYEQYCEKIRKSFKFDEWVQTNSTKIICVLVFLSSLVICRTWFELIVVTLSCIGGLFGTYKLEKSYERKCKRLDDAAESINEHTYLHDI
jgi:hypothetical protein